MQKNMPFLMAVKYLLVECDFGRSLGVFMLSLSLLLCGSCFLVFFVQLGFELPALKVT